MLNAIKEVMSSNRWIFSIFTLAVFYAVAKLLHIFSVKYLLQFAKKTKTDVDDLIIEKTNGKVSALIITAGVRIALVSLSLQTTLYNISVMITYTFAAVIIATILNMIVDITIYEWGKSISNKAKAEMDKEVLPLISGFSKVLVWTIAILVTLSIWGVEIGPFLASLGIAGIAIGFAVKDSLANIFGGVSLIMDKNIRVGDTIKIDKETGRVLQIGLRSTKIRTWDNEVKIMPNGILSNTVFVNYAQPDSTARISLPFVVEYGSKPDRVKKVVLEAIKNVNNILNEPEAHVRFHKMGDFSLDFKVYFWVSDYKQRFEAKDQAITEIYKALNKAKIGIPFPTRTVYSGKK